MTVVGAAVLHVVIGCTVYVAFRLGFAFCAVVEVTNSTGVLVIHHCIHVRACTFASVASSSIVASVCLAVVIDLGLKCGDGGHKGLHLFHHTLVLLGGISHFTELLLHLLFGDGFGAHGCLGVATRGQSLDDLVDDGDGVCLPVETEGIGGDGWLTSFDIPLRFSEMDFESRPSSVNFWLAVPFSDVTGKDGRTGDDDESDVDVDELSWCLGSFNHFGHVCAVIDCGEDVHDRFGVVVDCTLQGGLGGGQSLWSDGSIGFEKLFHDVWEDRAFEESCVVVDEVGEAALIDSSVDLLDGGAFDEVARLERLGGFGMEFSGCGDLGSRFACQVWEHRIDRSIEGDSRGDAVIGKVAAD